MFDPTKPVEGSLVDAAELRSQFTGLADLIAAVPAGPAGPEGPPGPMLNGAAVESVSSLPSGSSPSATATVDGMGVIQFQFTLVDGPQGPTGEVSQAQLQNDMANLANSVLQQASASSSNNSNAVPTVDTVLSTSELELLRERLNELILALRR